MANAFGNLYQGITDIKGTDTCFLIHRHEFPQDSKVAYILILCDIRPQKKETHRVRLTVGGNKLTYYGPVSIPTADLTTDKIHCNSILSTADGKYLIVDVNNFYLNNPTRKKKY